MDCDWKMRMLDIENKLNWIYCEITVGVIYFCYCVFNIITFMYEVCLRLCIHVYNLTYVIFVLKICVMYDKNEYVISKCTLELDLTIIIMQYINYNSKL